MGWNRLNRSGLFSINGLMMTPSYEKAIAKYYKSLRICPVPLVSWSQFRYCTQTKFAEIQAQWSEKERLYTHLVEHQKVVLVTNPDLTIVYVSDNIQALTGYKPSEVIGNTPKMFQGPMTLSHSRERIRKALAAQRPICETVLNYKKDGSVYACVIELYPKFTAKGELSHYLALEKIAS